MGLAIAFPLHVRLLSHLVRIRIPVQGASVKQPQQQQQKSAIKACFSGFYIFLLPLHTVEERFYSFPLFSSFYIENKTPFPFPRNPGIGRPTWFFVALRRRFKSVAEHLESTDQNKPFDFDNGRSVDRSVPQLRISFLAVWLTAQHSAWPVFSLPSAILLSGEQVGESAKARELFSLLNEKRGVPLPN